MRINTVDKYNIVRKFMYTLSGMGLIDNHNFNRIDLSLIKKYCSDR